MTNELLDEADLRLRHTGPEWSENQLTNHGPMAVETLIRRGHGDRVHRWLDRYLTRLDERPRGTAAITDATWRNALGDGRRVADWTDYFERQLAERPWREVLAVWWPRLLPGIAAGATHGVIRVGHAVRALLADGSGTGPAVVELGHGLAFWAARYRAVPGAPLPTGEADAMTALHRIPTLTQQEGTLAGRLARLPGTDGWAGAVASLRAPSTPGDARDLLADLVTAGTVRYLANGHASPVLLVHVATAPNAVWHSLPALPPAYWVPSLAAAWSAVAAVTAAYGSRAGAAPNLGAVPDDPVTVFDRAAEHGDEHVIKFTDTAVDVYQRTGDPAALQAAARVASLIAAP
ncbi:MAG TPA: questin oxidase family protein [Micromonosporaceae bacterium]|nr:questin oxidase family protein [Micromonosporaceae bacterium]